jgi:hypothetical protein
MSLFDPSMSAQPGIGKLGRFLILQFGSADWSYTSSSNKPSLDGKTGFITATAPKSHGVARSLPDGLGFAYDDGATLCLFGTTSYAWVHQPEGDVLEEETLASLEGSPFNKIRMTIFPKWYPYTHDEPRFYPFEGTFGAQNCSWDYGKFHPPFWQHLEKRVSQLNALGIVAEIILFHPYDGGHWGFDRMNQHCNWRWHLVRSALCAVCGGEACWVPERLVVHGE